MFLYRIYINKILRVPSSIKFSFIDNNIICCIVSTLRPDPHRKQAQRTEDLLFPFSSPYPPIDQKKIKIEKITARRVHWLKVKIR